MCSPKHLLPLESNLDLLPTELDARKGFLGSDGTSLVLVLCERDGVPARYQTDFPEAGVAFEDDRERVLAVVLGKVAQEQSLVGREVLVRDGTACCAGGLCALCWAFGDGICWCALGGCRCSSRCGLLCLLALCGGYVRYAPVGFRGSISRTLLREPVCLVLIQSSRTILSFNRRVGASLRESQGHWLVEERELLQCFNRILGALDRVVDDESLSLALQTLLRDDVDDVAELVKDLVESFNQDRDLDALIEVADLFRLC